MVSLYTDLRIASPEGLKLMRKAFPTIKQSVDQAAFSLQMQWEFHMLSIYQKGMVKRKTQRLHFK